MWFSLTRWHTLTESGFLREWYTQKEQFPSFIHSQKRNPQTHLKDPDMVWDFWSLRPESLHQGRLFAYPDTHRHRLGPNYLQIPVNCPYRARVANYQRDGPMCMHDNQGGAPNYYPNSFSAPEQQRSALEHSVQCAVDVKRFNSANEDNVTQVRTFYTKVLNEEERKRLCENIAGHLKDAQLFIQKKAVKNFTDVHPDYGARIQALLDKYNAEKPKNAIHTYTQAGSHMAAKGKANL